MGGHAAGDVAAQTAAEVIAEKAPGGDLAEAVRAANDAILVKASADADLQGMGTTVTAMRADGDSAKFAHVGDSRAYLLRAGELTRITRDHTGVDRLLRQGRITAEEALDHPARHRLERALGIGEPIDVDVIDLDLQPGDRIMLCTDGLSGMVTDDVIEDVLGSAPDPQTAAHQLVEVALKAGGHDNVTTVVVEVPGDRPAAVPEAQPQTTRSWLRRSIAGGLIVVVAILALGLAASARSNAYYIGDDSGVVAVFRGWPGQIFGYELSEVTERTDIEVDSLPTPFDERVREGIVVDDLEDAQQQIEHLRSLPEPDEDAGVGTP
jgi:protein phosphatase